MKVKIGTVELDPVYLLIHEPSSSLGDSPFAGYVLQQAINRWLEDHTPDGYAFVTMEPPGPYGSRWSLSWRKWEEEEPVIWTADRRIRTPGEIREALPAEIVFVLRALARTTLYL